MTYRTDPRRRNLGFAAVVAGMLVALPLTATSAINYVDVAASPPQSAPKLQTTAPALDPGSARSESMTRAAMPVASAVTGAPVRLAALAPVETAVMVGRNDISFISNDSVHINGVTKKWSELTPQERSRIRVETTKARRQLNEQLVRLPQEMAQAQRELDKFKNGDFQRDMAAARIDMVEAIAEIDSEAADLRANGQNPEKLKADIRRSMSEMEPVNVEKMVRESLASVDPEKIRADVINASKSLDEIEAKLNQLDRR